MKSHSQSDVGRKEVEDCPPMELQFSAKLKKKVGKDLISLYKASRSLLLLIPNMIKQASTEEMRKSLEAHFEAVQYQVSKLEALFASIEEKPKMILTRNPTWLARLSTSQKF